MKSVRFSLWVPAHCLISIQPLVRSFATQSSRTSPFSVSLHLSCPEWNDGAFPKEPFSNNKCLTSTVLQTSALAPVYQLKADYTFSILSHFFSMMLSQSHSAGSEVPCIPEQAVESEIGLILGKQASSFLCSFYDFFFVHAFASDMLARNRTPLILVPCNAFLSNKNLHDKSYHKEFLKTKL